MNFYRTIRFDGDEFPVWDPTLALAHKSLKLRGANQPAARIELFDVPSDKAGILALLNGATAEDLGLGAQNTWCLATRGGLKEIPNGE